MQPISAGKSEVLETIILALAEQSLEALPFELWFQPIYHLKTGTVLHNEVLLCYRAPQDVVYTPEQFLPLIARTHRSQELDCLVVRKALAVLASQAELSLAIKLSPEALQQAEWLEALQRLLAESLVKPKRLSFELSEAAIAVDFSAALKCMQVLNALGCGVALDSFTGKALSLLQCQQLPFNQIKLDEALIQKLEADPTNHLLSRATVEMCRALGVVIAQGVADEATLKRVQEAGIEYVQGDYCKAPSLEPDQTPLAIPLPMPAPPQKAWAGRLLAGAAFVSIGLTAVVSGLTLCGYRLTHLVAEGGLINSRALRVQPPIDGTINAFYVRPGTAVAAGQLLARIGPSPQEGQTVLQLQGTVHSEAAQMAAAKQSVSLLKEQLQQLAKKGSDFQTADIASAAMQVSQAQASVDTAAIKAREARVSYERIKPLLAQGVITGAQADQIQSTWKLAESEVKQAKTTLVYTQSALEAIQSGTASNHSTAATSLLDQQTKLVQALQTQTNLVSTLETQLASSRQRLQQAQAIYGDKQDYVVRAPFTGVVYATEHEQGEQVVHSTNLMTLLDCNDLWVEVVVNANDAGTIDTTKPVNVQLLGYSETFAGKVELLQPLSSVQVIEQRARQTEGQAILPPVPPELVGQPLVRVTVRIPPPPQHTQAQQFCGVGQATRLTFAKKQAWF